MFSENWNWVTVVDSIAIGWIITAVLCTFYVAWDQFRNNPEPVVMKWGFILVTLYMGPVGLLLYVLADKEPAAGKHEEFIKPLWKQGVGSTIHCIAGDATGIIAAAIMVSILGLPMWLDLWIEYGVGFLFGWFIFQSLFMKNMMGGSYGENVRKTFFAEFISMNAMMAGMAPVMIFLMMGRDMRAMDPLEPLFWLTMSISITVGFAIAYPVNVWMVKKGMKHGLMTQRGKPQESQNHAHHMAQVHADHEEKKEEHNDHHEHQQQAQQDNPHTHPKVSATRPQVAALAFCSAFMLIVGILIPNVFVNTKLSARDVGGVIMPPGMIMTRTLSGESMRDMRAILPKEVERIMPSDAQGDQLLTPRQENGYKVFDLDVSVFQWNILPNQTVDAYGFNGQVPGPRIRITEGDKVKINVTNHLPEATSVHWHGLVLDNGMDGAAEITQNPIEPGETFTYAFQAVQSGMYFYHSHHAADRQQALGLYGMLIIDPKDKTSIPAHDVETIVALQEWLIRDGLTFPAMTMEGAFPNYFTINGKSYPATETVKMKVGQKALVRFVGSNNNFVHPMHIHGGPFEVVALDGEPLSESARYKADTINVGPGQRYDVIWTALKPGKWLIHCHIPHHTTNDNAEIKGGGGLMMIIEVSEKTTDIQH
jgi:FtsP/CotA-like multicopper oxidase with cupredoxin domain